MTSATLTTKGQITIPIGVRNELKVDTGDSVEFVHIGPGLRVDGGHSLGNGAQVHVWPSQVNSFAGC